MPHILDYKGDIQIYVKRDDIGEESYAQFKTFDIGDIIGVVGRVFKTRTGEISIHAEKVEAFEQVPPAAAGEVPRLEGPASFATASAS